MTFRGLDYYALDDLLEPEEKLARDTVREFVDAEVMPIIGAHFRAGTFPADQIGRASCRERVYVLV